MGRAQVFRVFLSHSIAPWELALLSGMADTVAHQGALPFIPDRDWRSPDDRLPERVCTLIREADFIIALATRQGRHLPWMNQELAYASTLTPGRGVFVVADPGLEIPPGFDVVWLNRQDPFQTLSSVGQRIRTLIQDHHAQELLRWLVVGAVILLLLRGK